VALARIGVGIGTGKIQVDDKLKPGMIYKLPSLSILNTGDESSQYRVNVAYHEKQPELQPPQEWFIFTPETFQLEPGEGKTVDVKLNLPVKAKPGDYFAYLEGRPIKTAQVGVTTVGVAAAAKLYFTVIPADFIHGVYYKLVSFWKVYAPWPKRGAILAGIIVALLLCKKFFHIQINLKKPESKGSE
jgi:hypothetical protein